MPTSRDPRSYIKPAPLPIPHQKGLKLQARSDQVYNPTVPTREEVRKWNYDRRLSQLTCQGFNAYNYKPYRGLGDPFYLNEKELILHALGQWDEASHVLMCSDEDDEEDDEEDGDAQPEANMTAAKFVLRRTRKDLNTLGKEVVRGRNMIRNVRLGHGLFDMIKKERMIKKDAAMAEKQKNLAKSRNQWLPPKESDSEDSTDEEINRDEDLENYFGPSLDDPCDDLEVWMSQSLTDFNPTVKPRDSPTKKKKKAEAPRPFTPQHTNIAEMVEPRADISKDALFRQLCVLSWILDAMNIEAGSSMGPISTCWSHKEIGGSKISSKKAKEEKKAESDWERWLSSQQLGRVSKKGSVTRLNHRMTRTLSRHGNAAMTRMSVPSTQMSNLSPSSSTSQVNGISGNPGMRDSIEDRNLNSPQQTDADEEETLHRTGIFKFLDEYYDSLRQEAQRKEEEERIAKGITDTGGREEEAEVRTKSREGRASKKKKKDRQKTPERLSRLNSPEETNRGRFTLKDLRNENFRPKNSAELMEFHASKPSTRHCTLRQTLHNKFKEVHDDKAMTLHDILEQMERERLSKCLSKFNGLHTRSMSLHRALEDMRREGEKVNSRPNEGRRQSSFKGNWYNDLLMSIPYQIRDIWYYRTVLEKLGRYGLVENSSKQSVYKFLKVLESLRHWELCNPDVAAAIEFCRARIVDMSVEEFEEWAAQAFPLVARPKTAPPSVTRSQDESNPAKDAMEGRGGARSSVGSRGQSRAGARSAVSVADGRAGRLRLVQSAVAKPRD